MTRARAKLLQAKVNSLLSSCDFGLPLDGLLLHASTLCILRYEATPPHQATKEAGPGEEAAGALHTGVSGVDRSLRSPTPESPDLPPVQTETQARDSLIPPPETGPEIDRSLRPRPESPDRPTPGMLKPFGPGPCNPQFRPNFQFYSRTTPVYVVGLYIAPPLICKP